MSFRRPQARLASSQRRQARHRERQVQQGRIRPTPAPAGILSVERCQQCSAQTLGGSRRPRQRTLAAPHAARVRLPFQQDFRCAATPQRGMVPNSLRQSTDAGFPTRHGVHRKGKLQTLPQDFRKSRRMHRVSVNSLGQLPYQFAHSTQKIVQSIGRQGGYVAQASACFRWGLVSLLPGLRRRDVRVCRKRPSERKGDFTLETGHDAPVSISTTIKSQRPVAGTTGRRA